MKTKKKYGRPIASTEVFTPNQYVTACLKYRVVVTESDAAYNCWYCVDVGQDGYFDPEVEGMNSYSKQHANPQGANLAITEAQLQDAYAHNKSFWWDKSLKQKELTNENKNIGYWITADGQITNGNGQYLIGLDANLVPIENPNLS